MSLSVGVNPRTLFFRHRGFQIIALDLNLDPLITRLYALGPHRKRGVCFRRQSPEWLENHLVALYRSLRRSLGRERLEIVW